MDKKYLRMSGTTWLDKGHSHIVIRRRYPRYVSQCIQIAANVPIDGKYNGLVQKC